jgi:hypothetical protein
MERWRRSARLPDYLVSSHGNLMCVPFQSSGRWYGGQVIQGVTTTDQPRKIIVHKGKTHKVHQLICEAFHGPRPSPKHVVMHLDDNPLNNRADNLKWATQKENLNTPKFLAYCKARTGENSPTFKGRMKRAA